MCIKTDWWPDYLSNEEYGLLQEQNADSSGAASSPTVKCRVADCTQVQKFDNCSKNWASDVGPVVRMCTAVVTSPILLGSDFSTFFGQQSHSVLALALRSVQFSRGLIIQTNSMPFSLMALLKYNYRSGY